MTEHRTLKLLLADDDKPIANLYRMSLSSFFASEEKSPLDELEEDLFDVESVEDVSVSVTVCSQGGAAVSLAKDADEQGEPFDVIVLDIRMPPGISGVEAAQQIRSFDQKVPIIFVSGYSDIAVPELEERVPPPNLMCFMSKPVQLAQIADRIRDVANP